MDFYLSFCLVCSLIPLGFKILQAPPLMDRLSFLQWLFSIIFTTKSFDFFYLLLSLPFPIVCNAQSVMCRAYKCLCIGFERYIYVDTLTESKSKVEQTYTQNVLPIVCAPQKHKRSNICFLVLFPFFVCFCTEYIEQFYTCSPTRVGMLDEYAMQNWLSPKTKLAVSITIKYR